MAGRQRLQQGEERAEPVGALLGIGPGSLPPLPSFSLLLQSCSRSPLPKQGCPTAPQARRCHQNFAGSGRSHGRSSKASDVPMCGHAGPSPSPPLPLSSPRATVATLPRAPAPGHPSRNLPWPKDAQGSRQLAGTGGNSLLPPPPPQEPRNTTHAEIQPPPGLHRQKQWFSASVFSACRSPVARVRLPRDHLQGERQREEGKGKNLEISHSFYKLPQPGLPHAQNRKTTDLWDI